MGTGLFPHPKHRAPVPNPRGAPGSPPFLPAGFLMLTDASYTGLAGVIAGKEATVYGYPAVCSCRMVVFHTKYRFCQSTW